MEAVAKYDYDAKADEELSFRKGERLKILETTGNWYKAERNGDEGYVPQNFIDINVPSWYQKDMSRGEAQDKLMSQPVGAFVIRSSKSTALGEFSISVRHAADVQHFKVKRDSRGQYSLWSEKFTSLNQLVEYYKSNTISKMTPVFLQENKQQQRRGSDMSPPLPAPPHSSGPLPPVPLQRKTPPTSTRQVRALYTFQAEEGDELGFKAGDIIEVLESSDQAWWRGRVRGKTGLFPSNYTQPL